MAKSHGSVETERSWNPRRIYSEAEVGKLRGKLGIEAQQFPFPLDNFLKETEENFTTLYASSLIYPKVVNKRRVKKFFSQIRDRIFMITDSNQEAFKDQFGKDVVERSEGFYDCATGTIALKEINPSYERFKTKEQAELAREVHMKDNLLEELCHAFIDFNTLPAHGYHWVNAIRRRIKLRIYDTEDRRGGYENITEEQVVKAMKEELRRHTFTFDLIKLGNLREKMMDALSNSSEQKMIRRGQKALASRRRQVVNGNFIPLYVQGGIKD